MDTQKQNNNVIRLADSPHFEPSSTANNTVADAVVCADCNGTGMQIVPTKGARPCPCRAVDSFQRIVASARIPRRYQECSFSTYETGNNDSLYAAKKAIENLVRDYPDVKKGLLLVGSVGVGKTHLAVAMLKALIYKGVSSVRFCEFGSLLQEIRDSYSDISHTSELKVLAPVYEAEVLVIDELGASVPSDWVRETMYQIINRRYTDDRFTIFTTNYYDEPRIKDDRAGEAPSRSFASRPATDRIHAMTTLEERIGTRLRSRLHEMCFTLTLDGRDYRPLKQT